MNCGIIIYRFGTERFTSIVPLLSTIPSDSNYRGIILYRFLFLLISAHICTHRSNKRWTGNNKYVPLIIFCAVLYYMNRLTGYFT